jgi:hypothetical protein
MVEMMVALSVGKMDEKMVSLLVGWKVEMMVAHWVVKLVVRLVA